MFKNYAPPCINAGSPRTYAITIFKRKYKELHHGMKPQVRQVCVETGKQVIEYLNCAYK